MASKWTRGGIVIAALAVTAIGYMVSADELIKQGEERWQPEYMTVVKEGRRLWGSPEIGTNGVACGQCHPDAANTHPETYPKFQKQLGRVITLPR